MQRSLIFVLITACLMILICSNIAFSQMVKEGLIAYWPLDKSTISGNNVKDVIGKNDGTIKGAKAIAGKYAEALLFNGQDNIVDIPGTDSLDFKGKDLMTVCAWVMVKGDSGGTCCGPVVGQRAVNGFVLRWDNRNAGMQLEFIVYNGAWIGDGGFGVSPPKDEWHHVASVVDKTKLYIYLDGKKEKELAFTGTISSTGTATTFGGASDGFFNGIIDEAAIYNRALSEKEISQVMLSKGLAGNAVNSGDKLAICWATIRQAK
jgi:hypothetical protein